MKTTTPVLIIMIIAMACTNSDKESADMANDPKKTLSIKQSKFGVMEDGTEIDMYTMRNGDGMKVGVITYGGIIQSIEVPDRDGNLGDIALGHDNLQGYLNEGQNPYFGGIIGRYGNRIAKGQFTLDEETYQLATNNGPNHLHGGSVGFDKVIWNAEEIIGEDHVGVKLTYHSPDREEGYPGKMDLEVSYLLREDNSLEMVYQATTDKTTVVNMTNHTYFNLSEDKSTILEHQLSLNADRYLPVDSTLIPTGELRPVEGSPFDFLTMKKIGLDINQESEQLHYGGGFDHCWVFNNDLNYTTVAAELYEGSSGRTVKIYTTEPAIQFYSGNFLDGTITGKGNKMYPFRSGLCLETQHYPDSPNQADFPSTRLDPGETYLTKTKMEFGVRK